MSGLPPDEPRVETPADDEEPPGGPFPSWTAAYVAVAGATLLMVLVLYWFTVTLDHTGP